MKLMPSVYECPICGKLRGGKVNAGQHERCYRVQQKAMAAKNAEGAAKRAARIERTRQSYLKGSTLGVSE